MREALLANPILTLGGAWALTYLIHSTILLLSAWIATTLLRARLSDSLREVIWRAAMLGGLLTATAAPLASDVGQVIPLTPGSTSIAWPTLDKGLRQGDALASEATARMVDVAASGPEIHDPGDRHPVAATPWRDRIATGAFLLLIAVLPAAVMLGFLSGVLRLILAQRRLRGRLAGRVLIVDPNVLELLDDLRDITSFQRGVRLTRSDLIAVPMAFGVWRPEICLPERTIALLDEGRLRAVLAHELAHLKRFDPWWSALARLIVATFFVQPLNRLAARRLAEIAEYECDRAAVMHAARPSEFARTLTQVASWLIPDARSPLTSMDDGEWAAAATMAGRRSDLRRRIERLLDPSRPRPARPAVRRTVAVGMAVGLIIIAAAGPRIDPPPSIDRSSGGSVATGDSTWREAERSHWPVAESEPPLADSTVREALELLRRELRALHAEAELLRLRINSMDLADDDDAAVRLLHELEERLEQARAAEAHLRWAITPNRRIEPSLSSETPTSISTFSQEESP